MRDLLPCRACFEPRLFPLRGNSWLIQSDQPRFFCEFARSQAVSIGLTIRRTASCSTCLPAWAATDSTRPSNGIVIGSWVFIASRTASFAPRLNSKPGFARTSTIIPGIGAVTVPEPSAVSAPWRGGVRSKRKVSPRKETRIASPFSTATPENVPSSVLTRMRSSSRVAMPSSGSSTASPLRNRRSLDSYRMGSPLRPVGGRLLYERPEQPAHRLVVEGALRVPLDGHGPVPIRDFDRLRGAVLGMPRNAHVPTGLLDGLMVVALALRVVRADRFGNPRLRLKLVLLNFAAGVLHRTRKVGKVLDQGSSLHHVDELAAVTDAEYRKRFGGCAVQRRLRPIPQGVLKERFRVERLSKVHRVDVVATRDEQAVDQLHDLFRGRIWRHENGQPAGLGYRLSIVALDSKVVRGPRVAVVGLDVGRDADDWTH